jgi:tRNA(fMet)-specific endonuclease VapC
MNFLLDTDTFILLIRGTPIKSPRTEREKFLQRAAAGILKRCRAEQQKGHRVALSAISLAELEYGARKSGRYEANRQAFVRTLAPFETLAFDPVISVHHYGIVREALEAKGVPIGPLDTLVAAHAVAFGATLVTNNVKEFKRVKGLPVENWAS